MSFFFTFRKLISAAEIAPVVSDGTLTVSNLTGSGFDVSFTKATDNSAGSTLIYKLYINTLLQPMDTVSEIESNGSLESQGTDVTQLSVSGVSEGEDVDFNVIVEDPDGNKTPYNSNFARIPDVTAPTLPADSTLSTDTVQETSFNVNFDKATDNVDNQVELEYELYTSTTNNLTDVGTIETNGTFQDSGTDVTQLTASGLTLGTQYYFNILVKDRSDNKSIYTSTSETTASTSDTTAPTLPADTSLSTSSVSTSGWLVDFTKSTDNETAQANLVYKLYTSDSNNIDTVSNIEANGTLESQGTDVATLSVSSLGEGVMKWFNITVEDEAGNKSAYTQNSETTLDGTSPTVSPNKDLSTGTVSSSAFEVSYNKANDNVSSQANLRYYLYTSINNDVGTVVNAEANGTLQNSGGTLDVATLSASGLTDDTLYYFNVVVEDEANNKTAYNINSQKTDTLTTADYDGGFELQAVTLD